MTDGLIPIKAVEKRLGVARKTVLLLVTRAKLKGLKVGRQWRFDPRDIDAYIEQQKAAVVPRESAPRITVRTKQRPRGDSSASSWKGAGRYYQ